MAKHSLEQMSILQHNHPTVHLQKFSCVKCIIESENGDNDDDREHK
jgi:hypothetical protein